MPVVHRLQPSFNNGEISPLLYDRVDYNKFVSSIKSGKNMFVHPQGGVSNRAGTIMLAQAKDTTVRLIPFEFSSTETYVIEFGNGYCRFFTTNGQVVVEEGGVEVPYEIQSPFTTADLDKIRYCQSGDVMYIAWGGKPKTLTRYGHTNWQFADYDYKNGPLSFNKTYNGNITKTQASEDYKYILQENSISGNTPYAFVSKNNLVQIRRSSLDGLIKSITKANGKLFGLLNEDGVSFFVYSTDGITWNKFSGSPYVSSSLGNNPLKVLYNGSCYLMWAYGYSDYYRFTDFYSVSHYSFTERPYSYEYFRCINNVFFYMSNLTSANKTYYSSDGISWQLLPSYSNSYRTIPSYFYNNYFYGEGVRSGNTYLLQWDSSLSSSPTGTLVSSSHRGEGIAFSNKLYYTSLVLNNYVLYCYDIVNNTTTQISSRASDAISYAPYCQYFDGDSYLYCFNMNVDFSAIQIDSSNVSQNISSTTDYRLTKIIYFSFPTSESKNLLNSNEYIFNEKDVDSYFGLLVSFKAQTATTIQDNITNQIAKYVFSGTILLNNTWSLTTTGTWKGEVVIEQSFDGQTWQDYRRYPSAASGSANYNVSGSVDKLCFFRLSLQSFTGTVRVNFYTTGGDDYIFVIGKEVVSENSLSVDIAEESLPYFNYVLNSSCEIYLTTWKKDSYPTEVDLYQDRIVWATNNQLDATKISDYTNFGVSTDVTEDDAISVIVKDKKVDKINSIVAGQKLAVYSDDGNFIHHNDTFTPQSATFLKQGSTGGAEVKPVVVRDHIIYVHPMKQAISDYAYNFETDGYAGQDITILANHLFDGKEIKTMAYQQEPYSIIWVLQNDGTVLACTYLRQEQVIAWTPMDFGGTVKSIAVCSSGTKEELYLAVKRGNNTFVEKMPTRLLNSNPADCFFVDCGRTYRGEPATVISGLDYLEGQDVVVLADGNVVNGMKVTSGSITLPIAASVVTVGLPYESVLETLTFDANLEDGTTLNRKKRVVAVSVKYNNSRGSKVSVNGHREIDMLKRGTEGYNVPISLKSGFYREILPSTHNEATSVKIRQTDPLPITIVSVIPEIQYEK